MRVYLKNGRSIRVRQKLANELVEMIISQATDKSILLVQRHFVSKNVFSYFDINEIVAIK